MRILFRLLLFTRDCKLSGLIEWLPPMHPIIPRYSPTKIHRIDEAFDDLLSSLTQGLVRRRPCCNLPRDPDVAAEEPCELQDTQPADSLLLRSAMEVTKRSPHEGGGQNHHDEAEHRGEERLKADCY